MPINVRWIDTNKQDEVNSKYPQSAGRKRTKAVQCSRHSLVNPPIEMLTYIISRAANGKSRKWQINNIMANDVAPAYFHAPSTSSVFLELCQEDRRPEDEGMRSENFQCRCTARGPQQETHRRVTPTYPATANSVWLVGTCAFWDIRSMTLS